MLTRRVLVSFVVAAAVAIPAGVAGSDWAVAATPAASVQSLGPASSGSSVRLVLAARSVPAGSVIDATVIVVNRTGHAIVTTSCGGPFGIALESDAIPASRPGGLCLGTGVTVPEGRSVYPTAVYTSSPVCSADPAEVTMYPSCGPDGAIPPLPPGPYRVILFQSDPIAVVAPIAVTLVPGAELAPRCRAADLAIDLAANTKVSGSALEQYRLTNTSAATCSLDGYPALQVTDTASHLIGYIGQPRHTVFSPRSATSPVTIAPDETAFFAVLVAHCATSSSADGSTEMRVLVPEEGAPLFTSITGASPVCAGVGGGRSITISAFASDLVSTTRRESAVGT